MFEKKRKTKDFDMIYLADEDETILVAAYARAEHFTIDDFIERMWAEVCGTGEYGSTLSEFRGNIKKHIKYKYMIVFVGRGNYQFTRQFLDECGKKPTNASLVWFVTFNGFNDNFEKS